MESGLYGIKSLRIFFSYSTDDKEIVGKIKLYLEEMGFEVFLAHEDISPCEEWQDEIIKNLQRCDIFIPLLTDNFMKSEWTNQEIGIAVDANKFIIPLQVDIKPPGFLGHIQSLKISPAEVIGLNPAQQIFALIKNKSKFGKDMKNFVIKQLEDSGSFEAASARSKLLRDFKDFSKEELDRIVNATINSRCIYNSFGAQRVLKSLFKKYETDIEKEKYDKVMKLLEKVK
jgi:hypothetical protein